MSDTVLVGCGREGYALALPDEPASGVRRVLVGPSAAVADDDGPDPLLGVIDAVAGAERMVAATAAFRDELVVTAYREGAVAMAERLGHLRPEERREWGARDMLAELAVALRVPEATLAGRIARTTALGAFPRVRAAHLAGEVSERHVDGLLDMFRGVADEDVLARADAALVARATTGTAAELRAAARRWRTRHVPRTDEQRRRAVEDRRVTVSPADDDLCWLTALLPAAQAVAIYHRVDDLAAAVAGPDESRTADQLRADVFSALLLDDEGVGAPAGGPSGTGGVPESAGVPEPAGVSGDWHGLGCRGDAAAGGPMPGAQEDGLDLDGWAVPVPDGLRGIRPTVVVTVPALTLLGRSDEPAVLDGFGPIDLDTARELAGRATSWIRVLTHPETGVVLSVGRERYRPPADLRAAVAIRDGTCRFPGCRRRAARCDTDHALAHEYGGPTSLGNLEKLCLKHHRLKHQAGWTVRVDSGGTVRWRSPVGRTYRTEPAVRWPAPPPLPPSASPPSPSKASAASPRVVAARNDAYPDVPPF